MVALKRQLDVLLNLYQAVFLYVLWVNMRCQDKWPWQCLWRRSSKTFKGAAVKVLHHTQLPFGLFFVQLVGRHAMCSALSSLPYVGMGDG
jgi:hypothetical protein